MSFKVRYIRTVRFNIGDYEAIAPEVGFEKEFPDTVSYRDAYEEVKRETDALFMEEIARQLSEVAQMRAENPKNDPNKISTMARWALARLQLMKGPTPNNATTP